MPYSSIDRMRRLFLVIIKIKIFINSSSNKILNKLKTTESVDDKTPINVQCVWSKEVQMKKNDYIIHDLKVKQNIYIHIKVITKKLQIK